MPRGGGASGDTGTMLSTADIARLAAEGESETVEFKATTGQRTDAARTLSAMLNGNGGRVLFGVQPSGNVTGQQVGARTQEDVAQACTDIHPSYRPSIERVPVSDRPGREVLVATVPAGNNKPYSYKGHHYMRSGSSTVKMPDEIQVSLVLERAHSMDRWELGDSERAIDAISENEVRAFRDEAIAMGRAKFDADASIVDVLRSLGLLQSDGRPNRGAIALFGRPDAFAGQYPTLGCRLLAVDGTDIEEEFRDDVLVEDNISASLRRAISFCEEHLHRAVRISTFRAEVAPEIPAETLREALANAFGHRDYALSGLVQIRVFYDRLEVWSPGRLHFGLTPADLYGPHSSHPWNPNVFSCLYRRGIVEQLGSGTLRMVRLCVDAGLGRPVFAAPGSSVMCSVPRRGYWLAPDGSSMTMGELETAVLAVLAEGPTARGRIAARVGVTSAQVRETLVHLGELGLVQVEGLGRGSSWMLCND